MKYIRKFENSINEPQQFDYATCSLNLLKKDFSGKIGRITITDDISSPRNYKIEFEDRSSWFPRENILFFSKKREDVEAYLDMIGNMNKYNL